MIASDDALDDEVNLVLEVVDTMVFVDMIEKLLLVEIVVLVPFVLIIDEVSVENPLVEIFTALFCFWGEAMSRLGRITNHCTRNLSIC